MRYQGHNMFTFFKQKLLINKDIFEFEGEFYSAWTFSEILHLYIVIPV
jgi:hypothetical protein